MYFRTLGELELILFGHQCAFEQLKVIDRDQSFNYCYSQWLYDTREVSGSAGWAYAIESMASANGDDAEALFSQLSEEFLRQWNA